MQNYDGAVPAVQKTIAVLEHLRGAETAPTLTELAKALELNRSSLLAILNTLRAAGFVLRDEADRYHLGPSLLAYAPSVARANGPLEAFEQPAQLLVDALGETVALVRLTPQGAVYVSVKTGYYAVRAVVERGHVSPALSSAGGLAVLAALPAADAGPMGGGQPAADAIDRTRQAGWALIEDALELGQVSLAAPVCDFDGQPVAAIELLGPAYRIVGDGLRQAADMVVGAARQASLALGCADYRPYASAGVDFGAAAGLQGVELDAFLAEPWLASLACLRENGYPYTVPVWYEWRDGAFWLVPRAGSRWAEYVRLHPQVSMTISEAAPPFRRVLVEGLAELAPRAPAAAIERRMAQRYLGPHAESYLRRQSGRAEPVFRIVPEKLTSWTGLVAHPKYSLSPQERAGERALSS